MHVENAVRFLAGSLVTISLALGLLHSPHWFWLTGFVALNLMQSAWTGLCPAEWVFEGLGFTRPCAEAAE